MISLDEAKMTAKKMKDLQSTKKIILGRESEQGEQEAERARKGRVSEATNNEMLGQVEFEEIHTESECSQSDEDEESYNTSILDVFKEIEIRGDGNWLFRAFIDQEYHLTVREMIWDYINTNRNRFKEFIDQEMDSYIENMIKSRTWRVNIEIIGFAELFKTNIFIWLSGRFRAKT